MLDEAGDPVPDIEVTCDAVLVLSGEEGHGTALTAEDGWYRCEVGVADSGGPEAADVTVAFDDPMGMLQGASEVFAEVESGAELEHDVTLDPI